jgi:periplasmic copper chaperone A
VSPARRRWLGLLASAGAVLAWPSARAHGSRLGAIEIDHPYALPTAAGQTQGAAYLRRVRNHGDRADRLIAARTPFATAVELHRSQIDAQGVMRMRAEPALPLPAGADLRLRHGGEWHLMLSGLKAPLQEGQRFPLTLHFEHAGTVEVSVWVQRPRGMASAHGHGTPHHP